MHSAKRTLVVSLSAVLLVGCAASSPKQPATAGTSTTSNIRPGARGMFLANMLAAAAARGGHNPNPAYRAVGARVISARKAVPVTIER